MKILVIDDDEYSQKFFIDFIGILGGEILNAYTSEEAERMLFLNPDVAAIVMDGHLGEKEQNTASLITRIRESYKGPIWGNTGDRGVIALLKEAGCDEVFFKTPGKGEKGIRDQLDSFFTRK
ncbi:MAG: response regulator [Candidatus Paceibacterota bacterium]